MENNSQPSRILQPGQVPIQLKPAEIHRGHEEYLQLTFDLGKVNLIVQVRLVDYNFIEDKADVLVGSVTVPKPPETRIIL